MLNFVDVIIYLTTFGSIYEKINVGENLAHKKTNRYTYTVRIATKDTPRATSCLRRATNGTASCRALRA